MNTVIGEDGEASYRMGDNRQVPPSEEPLTLRKIVLTKVLAPFMISMAVAKIMHTQAQEIEPVHAPPKMKPMMGQSS
jgi:hypothetical protein